MTDNDLTDRIFNDATQIKSGRKRNKQVYLNFKEAQDIFNEKTKHLPSDDSDDYGQEVRHKNKANRKK